MSIPAPRRRAVTPPAPRRRGLDSARAALRRAVVESLEVRRLFVNSAWAFPGADGHLLYQPQPLGDHIEDFGMVGYQGGSVPIPGVAVKVTISPVAGDNTAN